MNPVTPLSFIDHIMRRSRCYILWLPQASLLYFYQQMANAALNYSQELPTKVHDAFVNALERVNQQSTIPSCKQRKVWCL